MADYTDFVNDPNEESGTLQERLKRRIAEQNKREMPSNSTVKSEEVPTNIFENAENSPKKITPSPPKQESETTVQFKKRQYKNEGIDIPDDVLTRSDRWENFQRERRTVIIPTTLDTVKWFFGPLPRVWEWATSKFDDDGLKYEDVSYSFTDPSLATLKDSPIRKEVMDVDIAGTAARLTAPFPQIAKKTYEGVMEEKSYDDLAFSMSDPTLATLKDSPIKKEVMEAEIAQPLMTTGAWLYSPAEVGLAYFAAPWAHQYESEGFFAGGAEALQASGKGVLDKLFPSYGNDPEYGNKITEKAFPGVPEWAKPMLATSFELMLDPAIVFSLALGVMSKIGMQATRAQIKAGIAPTESVLKKGLREMFAIGDLDPEYAKRLQASLEAAEAGDKAAIAELQKILEDSSVTQWAANIANKSWGDTLKRTQDAYANTFKELVEEQMPAAVKEYKEQKIKSKIEKRLGPLKEKYKGDEYKRRADHLKAVIAKEKMKKFGPKDYSEIDKIANKKAEGIREAQKNKYAVLLHDYSTREGKDQIRHLLRNKEGFRAIKANIDLIKQNEFLPAVDSILQEYVKMYEAVGGGKITMSQASKQAAKLRLENVLDADVAVNMNVPQYFAAHSLIRLLHEETSRLAIKALELKDGKYLDAWAESASLLSRAAGTILRVEEMWGQMGKAMQMVKGGGGVALPEASELVKRLAKMEDIGADTKLIDAASAYIHADRIGIAPAFLRRLKNGERILEDSLYEAYVNSILSAMRTSKVNLTSTAFHTIAQPFERLGSIFTGNRHAIRESGRMFQALADGFKDALLYATESAAQTKFVGRVLPEHAKDAMKVRMQGVLKKYPDEYLDPFGYDRFELGRTISEVDEINSRRKISSLNWGWNPQSWYGKGLDWTGAAVRSPGNFLKLQDLGFKFMGYNMGARLHAYQMLAGNKKYKSTRQLNIAINKMIYDPSDTTLAAGRKMADYVTFQTALGKHTAKFQKPFQNRFFRWYFPFYKTPINVIKVGMERTPLGYAKALDQWSKGNKDEARMAATRATIGLGITGALLSTLDEDVVIGGYDIRSAYGRKMKSLNKEPYSINTENYSFGFGDLEYVKSTYGLLANYRRVMAQLDFEDPVDRSTAEDITAAVVIPIAKMALDQNWLSETGRLIYYVEALRAGELDISQVAQTEFGRKASATIPFSALRKEFTQIVVDPEFKMAQGFIEEVMKQTPGLSGDLASYRNLWGEPMIASDAFGPDMHHRLLEYLTPIRIRTAHSDYVSNELKRIPLDMPSMTRAINGVKLNMRQKSDIQKYTGTGVNSLPLMDAMYREMNKSSYQRATDNGRANIIERIIRQYRRAAVNQIIKEDKLNNSSPDSLYNKIRQKQVWKQEQFIPSNKMGPNMVVPVK